MTNILLLTSSPRGKASYSTQLARELSGKIEGAHVAFRDLTNDPLPHIGPDFVGAVFMPEADRTPDQREALALSDRLIAELNDADIVVIGAGMINFSVPSGLKSWLDHVTRAGVTFRYGAAGPEGLVTGKKVILVLAKGGVYSSGPMASLDHMEPHLQSSLGFLGMTDVETVLVEGTAMGPEATEEALTGARAKAAILAESYSPIK